MTTSEAYLAPEARARRRIDGRVTGVHSFSDGLVGLGPTTRSLAVD
jgi:hypothetical protein